MSNLSKRPAPPTKPACKDSKQTPRPVAAPPVTHTFTKRTVQFLLGAVGLSALALYVTHDSVELPALYALCSRIGRDILTVDEADSRVQCLVVKESYLVDTGDLEDVTERWGSATLPVRYIPDGSIVVPGLSDSHCHILEYGASRMIPLDQGKTVMETVRILRDYIASQPALYRNASKVVEGWGWDHASWDTDRFPTADDLDADPITRGRSIILQSKDGHAIWVSHKILSANLIPDTVEGGIIIRDEAGNPTGIFMDSAQDVIARPVPAEEDLEQRFLTTVRDALSHGLTSLHDAGFKPDSLKFFQRQADQNKLPLRIYGMTYFDEQGPYWGDKKPKLVGAGNGRLTARSVKLFADGALRTGGAALYEPYADNPSTNGVMRLPTEVFEKVIPQFLRDGWQVNVHAIGDRANGIVLDAFEAALKGINVTALRPRLEHAQIMTNTDVKRVGKLGVIASIQPTHAISDMWYAQDRLGPERVKGLYAFRSLIDGGARITLGSDFPVEGVNPLAGFYAAITRVAIDGTSPHGPDGWFPEQRLTRVEALRGMTIDPAYASFTESTLGSLVPGKRADYVVLSQDIMAVPVTQILDTKVVATVIDGRPAYGHL